MSDREIEALQSRAAADLQRGDLVLFAGAVLLVTHPIADDAKYPKVVAVINGRPDTLMVSPEWSARLIGHVDVMPEADQ
jgi:hypothetical protein